MVYDHLASQLLNGRPNWEAYGKQGYYNYAARLAWEICFRFPTCTNDGGVRNAASVVQFAVPK
jgi:hypothetical protein